MFQGAGQWSDRAVQQLDNIQDDNVRWPLTERIAASYSSFARQQSFISEVQQDLLKKFNRDISAFRQILDLVNPLILILSNQQQSSERIFRSPGNPHSESVNPKTPEVSRVFGKKGKKAGENV